MSVIKQIVNGLREKKIGVEQIEEIANALSRSEQDKLLIALKELHSVHNGSLIKNKENLINKTDDVGLIEQALEDINLSTEEVKKDLKVVVINGEEMVVTNETLLQINYFKALVEVDSYTEAIENSSYLLPILESFIDRLALKVS